MRVVLEVTSGPKAGRKIRLGAGQELRVGRTEWADFSVPEDGQMSGVHFALETDNTTCYIRDSGSSNGTFVNGRQITERVALSGGDEIRAGQTLFVVHAEGNAAPRTADTPAAARGPDLPQASPAAAPVPFLQGEAKVTYTVEKCGSGLTLCRGNIEEISPQELATSLCRVYPVYLIVDFNNLGTPPPGELSSPDYLFDWLEPDAAAMVSPVVLGQTDLLGWPALVEQGWGKDAVICLFSKQDKPALLAHLRQVIRAKPKREDLSGGIVGYCWPSVMAMLLAHGTPEFVQKLLAGIDAVQVELPDLPDTWQLYGSSRLAGELDQLGFVHKSPPATD